MVRLILFEVPVSEPPPCHASSMQPRRPFVTVEEEGYTSDGKVAAGVEVKVGEAGGTNNKDGKEDAEKDTQHDDGKAGGIEVGGVGVASAEAGPGVKGDAAGQDEVGQTRNRKGYCGVAQCSQFTVASKTAP